MIKILSNNVLYYNKMGDNYIVWNQLKIHIFFILQFRNLPFDIMKDEPTQGWKDSLNQIPCHLNV